MVLTLKRWKSRSSPGIAASELGSNPFTSQRADPHGQPFWRLCQPRPRCHAERFLGNCNAERPPELMRGKPRSRTRSPALEAKQIGAAGWSSPVARQAHNLKVVGSNPTPATTLQKRPVLPKCRAFVRLGPMIRMSRARAGPLVARVPGDSSSSYTMAAKLL